MEHSTSCSSFESCIDCYDKYYSFEAVIAQLEREANANYINTKLANLRYERSEEGREQKRIRFRKKFGIEAFEAKVTKGEKELRQHKKLGRWRVEKGMESRLRMVWTVVREDDGEKVEKLGRSEESVTGGDSYGSGRSSSSNG
jgi:hypothetical protein